MGMSIYITIIIVGGLLGLRSFKNEVDLGQLPKEVRDYMKDTMYMR